MRALILGCVLLTGCGEQREWKCIHGLVHEHIYGAWVQLDGHPFVDFENGPMKCAEESQTNTGGVK